MDSPLLTTLDGRRRFVDAFDALLSRWQAVAGTLTVSGGALQASALGDWGPNLIPNGETWEGDPAPTDWDAYSATIARVDSAVDPGVPSGGADNWVAKVVNTSTATPRAQVQLTIPPFLAAATYRLAARLYAPSGNDRLNAARAQLLNNPGTISVTSLQASGDDAWLTLSGTGRLLDAPTAVQLRLYAVDAAGLRTVDDVAYFDSVQVYRQNAAAIRNVAPAFRARLAHISPAAPSVVPAGWMFRYTDALNYWELRVLPNTAGNDMQIVQVTAGEETVRAEADVDWTAEGTDEVELIVRGSSITTRYRKAGGVWTTGPSYASATQGAQSPYMGPLVYGTTTARWARVEVDW